MLSPVTGSPSAVAALTAAAPLGPFFGLSDAPAPGWTSWAQLGAAPDALRERLAAVRAGLSRATAGAEVPEPVAVSITHLGLVARLVAPVLGAALVTGTLPVAPAEAVSVRLSGSEPLPLAIAPTAALDASAPGDLATGFGRHWLDPVVGLLTAAARAAAPLSDQVLTGNVTSAVAGALRMAAASRPDLAARADAVLDELLATGSLSGTGRRRTDGSFARRSCCLYYRLPGAGTCADCVLADG